MMSYNITMEGTLYIVATPIGNLTDITQRALNTLESADFVLAEDSRVVSNISKHFDIQINTLIYHQHSGATQKENILNLLNSGKNLALVTDAGTPGISDPGNELINYLLFQNPEIKVVPVPGPSSLTAALSVCGFNVSKFIFLGFFPKRKKSKTFKIVSELEVPVVYFDSPYRFIKNLRGLEDTVGQRRICVCRELTKIHETIYRGTISEVLEKLGEAKIRGEIVVVIEGK